MSKKRIKRLIGELVNSFLVSCPESSVRYGDEHAVITFPAHLGEPIVVKIEGDHLAVIESSYVRGIVTLDVKTPIKLNDLTGITRAYDAMSANSINAVSKRTGVHPQVLKGVKIALDILELSGIDWRPHENTI